jgi:hypothetical protein
LEMERSSPLGARRVPANFAARSNERRSSAALLH